MCKLTNQSFSHLLVWFRELCETNPGDNLMDSWIERTWIIQTWISNTILSVLQKRENRNTFLGTFELYLIGMHQPVLPLKRVLREVESSFLGLVLQMGEKRILGHWAAWLDFKVCRICLRTFFPPLLHQNLLCTKSKLLAKFWVSSFYQWWCEQWNDVIGLSVL